MGLGRCAASRHLVTGQCRGAVGGGGGKGIRAAAVQIGSGLPDSRGTPDANIYLQ